MDNFSNALSNAFDAAIAEEFTPGALYYDCMDYVEYVANNGVSIADRIDGYLTLLWDASGDDLYGFRIKGFQHLFNTRLKDLYNFNDKDFLPMISVIEAIVEQLGHELIRDNQRHQAYRRAYRLAAQSGAKVYEVPVDEAA